MTPRERDLLTCVHQATRYNWLRLHATGRQHNELMDLHPEDWDAYIDAELARRGIQLTPPRD